MYSVKVLTAEELRDLYQKTYCHSKVNLEKKIEYFHCDDFHPSFFSDKKHEDTLRFTVVYNEKDILGICKFAWWECPGNYSISYLSTNKDYLKQGISKILIEETFRYFSNTYPNETLNFSGYSIEGWKYLRNSILEASVKHRVPISEKAIEYITEWTDEKRKLFDESREIIKNTYGYAY